MKVIDQSFYEIDEKRLFQKIELCGRVCYKSEDKITENSAINFVKKICVNNHGSVLEHYCLAFFIDEDYYRLLKETNIPFFILSNISKPIVSFNLRAFVTQYNLNHKNEVLLPIIAYMHENYPELFEEEVKKDSKKLIRINDFSSLSDQEREIHQRISIKLITDRGVSHELVRHRLASFSQESTRYCNYGKDKFNNQITVIRPTQITDESYPYWEEAMKSCEQAYFKLLEKTASPQLARSVLPNSLKTELCITASIEEWKLIFDLRCSQFAHPDVRILMSDVKAYFIKKGYIKNDID